MAADLGPNRVWLETNAAVTAWVAHVRRDRRGHRHPKGHRPEEVMRSAADAAVTLRAEVARLNTALYVIASDACPDEDEVSERAGCGWCLVCHARKTIQTQPDPETADG